MKIIIFTYKHRNYGAVLQCYALYHYLSCNVTKDVKVLDYTTKYHLKEDAIFKKRSNNHLKQLIYLMLSCLRYIPLILRRKRTSKFKRENISFTDLYSSKQELLNNIPVADIYITGSDQVFNFDSENLDVYYLNFPKNHAKKIAYAPSFGTSTFPETVREKIYPLLVDFDALSCREEDGAAFISSITKRETPTVIDPSLLLKSKEWINIAKLPGFSKKYILIYDLNGREDLVKIAKTIQKETGLSIVCITDKIEKFYKVDKQIYSAGPAEFLGWFAMASYVVTDSFHGTVFSIQFNKPFYTYIAIKHSAARIITLLDKLNLSNRIISSEALKTFVFEKSNYIVDEALLDKLRLTSAEYLNKNCRINE